MKSDSVILITGGTGGHVIPAVNLGNYMIDNGNCCYLLVDNRGIKYTSNFKGKIIKIYSAHLGYNFFDNIRFFVFLPIGFIQSAIYLIKICPTKGIAFGSYASFMPLLILSMFKVFGLTEIFLHEQNSVMGKVNKIFSRFANKIFLNFDITKKLGKKYINKSYLAGSPQNHTFNYSLRSTKIKENKIKKIFVSGGSQGAFNLNYSICNILIKIHEELNGNLEIVMQCPFNQIKYMEKVFKEKNIKYEIKQYYNDILKRLYETDVLITRAGAGTINDVVNTQTPTIFIPLPKSTHNHQLNNAKYLEDLQASIIINENKLNKEESYLIIKDLIKNTELQANLINNLQKINNIDANTLIYKEMNLL